MHQHAPQLPPLDDQSDHLAASVLRSLGRSFHDQFSITAGDAAIGGLLTFGVLPLWRLHRQFRDYITFEKQQLWHLAEWLRVRRGGEEALALHHALRKHRTSFFLSLIKFLGVAMFVGVAFAELQGRFQVRRLIDQTYRVDWVRYWQHHEVWIAWVAGVGIAYGAHWLQVVRHERRLERFAERFNRVALREGVAPIDDPPFDFGLNTGWIIGAGLLAWLGGALWAIPMALAGAVQRRYINRTATRVRGELLDRARAMIAQQRPAVAVPSYVIHGRRCDNPRCQAPMKAGARFCSRCGTSSGVISEVA
ncbi:MAG: hypothetical protein QOE14_1134 [Humisphaera sp.]|nr:hypothetical protein [Humisphaera sp.]